MKRIIILSIFFSFFSGFIINKEVLASRRKRAAIPPLTNPLGFILYNTSAADPRIQPGKYCDSNKCTPTVIPPPGESIDLRVEATSLLEAMAGYGTNEHKIIDVLTRRGIVQRMQIAEAYRTLMLEKYKATQSLPYRLDDDIGGTFQLSIMALMTPLPILFAKEIHESIAPVGTDYQVMVETFCSISNYGIKSIREFYPNLYNVGLDFEVKGDTSGSLQTVLVSLAQGKRDETLNVDNAKVVADAKVLNGADAKPWNAKPAFADILGTRNNAHLRQLFIEYKKISGREIEDDIKKEFPGPQGEGLLAIVKCIRSKVKYFAEKLDEILRTKKNRAFDIPMIRILVSRSEIDLGDIKVEYEKIYKKTLHSSIEKKIGGDYRRVLTNMILGTPPPAPPKTPGK